MPSILFYIAAALLLVQLLYYFGIYHRIYRYNRASQRGEIHFHNDCPPLSVIITASDEAEQLRRNLPAILTQDYPDYEVIVIDDGRSAETEDLLTLLEDQYPHLYHSFVPASSRYVSRRKLAITLGIKAAKYDWVVLTHADCRPESNQWLRLMARHFTPHTQVVLGHSGYRPGKGWLPRMADFDLLLGSMRRWGFALAGMPYTGIGRNLAYRKELFYQVKGFSSHLHLQRGEDDLFVNQVAHADNTRVECSPAAAMRRDPLVRSKEWWSEKASYTYTSRYCRGAQRWLAGGETCSRLCFYGCNTAALVTSLLDRAWWMAGAALLLGVIRWGLQLYVFRQAARSLGESHRYYTSLPLFDLLQPLQSLRCKIAARFLRATRSAWTEQA